jgi:hypothetical protein
MFSGMLKEPKIHYFDPVLDVLVANAPVFVAYCLVWVMVRSMDWPSFYLLVLVGQTPWGALWQAMLATYDRKESYVVNGVTAFKTAIITSFTVATFG